MAALASLRRVKRELPCAHGPRETLVISSRCAIVEIIFVSAVVVERTVPFQLVFSSCSIVVAVSLPPTAYASIQDHLVTYRSKIDC